MAGLGERDGRPLPRRLRSDRPAALGRLLYLIEGKTITGFANVEEDFADHVVGRQVMPWRIEDAARARGANYVQGGLWEPFAIRDGRLITGQQQYSGGKVAQLVIEALGR